MYQYNLNNKNHFTLNIEAPEGSDEKLKEVKIDSKFDSDLYHKPLMEIDRLSKHHNDFAINHKKIEEIRAYKNSLERD